jgi:hypothetical protein
MASLAEEIDVISAQLAGSGCAFEPDTPAAADTPAAPGTCTEDAQDSGGTKPAQFSDVALPPAAPVKATKRGPGRPSKTPATPHIMKIGVVTKPRYPSSAIEFGYEHPQEFKTLSSFLGKLKCTTVYLHATSTSITLNSVDATGQVVVAAVMNGTDMNYYFCLREIWLSINFADIESVFKHVDRSHTIIKFLYSNDDASLFHIHLRDSHLDKVTKFPVSVTEQIDPPDTWDSVMDLYTIRDNSLLSWRLPSKSFKKTNDLAVSGSPTVTVQYTGGSDALVLEWLGSSFAPVTEVYRDFDRIRFQSSIPEDEVFTISYSAMCGKNLSAAVVDEYVHLYCWADRAILAEFKGGGISVVAEMQPILA